MAGEKTTKTIYNLLKEGFKRYPDKYCTRLNFKHPKVEISANIAQSRYRSENGSVDLTQVWFSVLAKEPITEDQVCSAIALFHPLSKYDGGGFSYFTETKSLEDALSLDQIPSFYESRRNQLSSISDISPAISIFTDKIIKGPVKVPNHRWGRVYCAFEDFDSQNAEFGFSKNSVVLYKDGISLRIAKAANLIHAITPTLAEILEKVDAENDPEVESAIRQVTQFAIEQDKITSEKDILKRLKEAPQPVIMASELEDIAAYASKIAGQDIRSLEYQPSENEEN